MPFQPYLSGIFFLIELICNKDNEVRTTKGKYIPARKTLYKKLKGHTKNRKVINIRDIGKIDLYIILLHILPYK